MLVNGDLVRIPQGTVVNQEGMQAPLPIAVLNVPSLAIVLESSDQMAKLLVNDEVIYVEKKFLQLIGGKSVRKII